MKHRFKMLAIVLTLSLLCVMTIYFSQSPLMNLVACICLLTVYWGYIYYIRQQADKERKAMLESVQRTASSTLGHHRHDWMNDLQILYGYIQMGKHDKLAGCVERIKGRLAIESKISGLGIPSLVFYLQAFREMNDNVQLVIDIEDNLDLSQLLSKQDAEKLTEVIMDTVSIFQSSGSTSWSEMSTLKLSLYQEGNEVVVSFDRETALGSVAVLERHIAKLQSDKKVTAEQVDSNLPSLQIRMSCGNINEVNQCL